MTCQLRTVGSEPTVWESRTALTPLRGNDPASVAFDAVKADKSRGTDVLLIDTAGRLHNKKELMDELADRPLKISDFTVQQFCYFT